MPTIRVRIRGRLQGVAFRYFTQRQATSLGLGGFVRNLADGSVEVEVSGERVASALECGPDSRSPSTNAPLIGTTERFPRHL